MLFRPLNFISHQIYEYPKTRILSRAIKPEERSIQEKVAAAVDLKPYADQKNVPVKRCSLLRVAESRKEVKDSSQNNSLTQMIHPINKGGASP